MKKYITGKGFESKLLLISFCSGINKVIQQLDVISKGFRAFLLPIKLIVNLEAYM